MKHKIVIYAENPTVIESVLKQIKYQNIGIVLKDIYEIPRVLDTVVTFLIVENQETLESLNVEQAELLIVIISSTLSVKNDNKLSDTIVYRRKSDESNQAAINGILLGLVLPYISNIHDGLYGLELVDFTSNSLSFNDHGYLVWSRFTVEQLLMKSENLFSQNMLINMQNSPALVTLIQMDREVFTLAKINEIIRTIAKKVGDDYSGDCFYDMSQKQPNAVEEVYVLYTISA